MVGVAVLLVYRLNPGSFLTFWRRVALGLLGFAFVLSLIFAPWLVAEERGKGKFGNRTVHAPIYSPPEVASGYVRLQWEIVLVEWAALGLIGGALQAGRLRRVFAG